MIAVDFLVHGILLQEMYHTTADIWRSVEEMQDKIIFIYLSRFFHLLAVVALYEWISKNVKISPIAYGAIIGAITGAIEISRHSYMPISAAMTFSWVATAFAQGITIGLSILIIRKIFK
jgi:hypothetical protein